MMTMEEFQKQENETILSRFTAEDAWRLGNLVRELAGENVPKLTIEVRRGLQLMFFTAGEDSILDNESWIRWKRSTVERFKHSSFYMMARYGGDVDQFFKDRSLHPEEYTPHGGGHPVFVKDVGMAGTLTVSGLADHEDHQLCVDALLALKKEQGA